MMIDRIVTGIGHDEVRHKLLFQTDLTLRDAVRICRAEEAATKTEDGIALPMPMNVMKMINYRRQKQNRHDVTKGAAEEEKKATANRGTCKNCGWYIHTHSKCLAADKSPLWHGSMYEEDALQLERIQTAVARCILQAPWHTPKSELLQALDWPSLRWRREIASLCLLHRFLNLQQEPLTNCPPPFASSRNPRSQRKPRQLILPAARTTRHTTSFFFSASVAWNTLPAHIQNLTNAQQFRKALTKHFYSQRFTLLISTIAHAQ